MKKVMLVFGTRPDAIKMCPLVKELKKRREIQTVVCVSGQHREMLKDVLEVFDVHPDYDLDIMRTNQSLGDITVMLLCNLGKVLTEEKPDIVLVHGDTTTAFSAALAAFYRKIPIGHIEAGLRSNDMFEPFPEEYNRRAISLMACYDFAPTDASRENLLREGKSADKIFVTGNTVSDALRINVRDDFSHYWLDSATGKKLIVLTVHRRENVGAPMREIFRAVKRILLEYEDVCVLYPVHPNPRIREIVFEELGNKERVYLSEPIDTVTFHNILHRCFMIITDSGGIQEEATILGKPTVVLRDRTERPEGEKTGNLIISGTEKEGVYKTIKMILSDPVFYEGMCAVSDVYGSGNVCEKISDQIIKILYS